MIETKGRRKYTKGPWKIGTLDNGQTCIRGEHGGLVAVCEAGYQQIREENAKLIAAAPRMYEALKEADELILRLTGGRRSFAVQLALEQADGMAFAINSLTKEEV